MDLSLLDSVPDAMLLVNEGGTIVYANRIVEELFGWTRDELLGRPVEMLLPTRYRTMHKVHREGYQSAPRTRPMGLGLDLSGLRKDGVEFSAEISLSPLAVDGCPFVIAAVRDVTERKKLEEHARQWRRAREEVRERDEFLSVASHELRTPVTALQLQLQLLRRAMGRSTRERPEVLEVKLEALERQARRIALLVNELLDVSRMRQGSLELRREEFDLAQIARETAASIKDELARSGSRLRLELSPARGRFDRARVEQVIANLLLNAIKFGEGKPIELAVGPQGSSAVLRVSDAGIGIPIEHQARVFERFERAVAPRHFGGLGLGLWVVRQIVEAHGGEIRVESTPGAGATFTVELPLQPAELGAQEPAQLH